MELLLQGFILLAAGVVAVPLASRLGLGSVLGYLIAGALIGPFFLKLLDDPETIMHAAEFGVVMMLFLIGLELQPRLLWRMRRQIVGLGGMQVLFTTVLIGNIAWLLGQHWKPALAIGLILSLSSTAIALQILAEKNLMKTEGGKLSFSVLLFQDIAVIPIIAILPVLALAGTGPQAADDGHGGSLITNLPGWQQALFVIGAVGSIILAGRFLTRPLFRFIADSGLREIFTATALLLVIGIALLMQTVGLSPALGAFVAGVVLADSEYRHELEANIDPFKALLLGFFFISVGASIDFGLLAAQPVLIGLLVAGLVLLKFAILWILARTFGLHAGERYWFSFALAQGGEFGFVLLSFALQNRVLPADIVNILTVSIALSMVLTPILILLNERLIQPHFQGSADAGMPDEAIDLQDNPVIIAGFGRFGQIVGRMLISKGVPVTVMDRSPAQIEQVRQFGFKVFYGDVSREELLHAAGAEKARLLIITVGNRDDVDRIIDTAQHHFPHLQIYARAYDVLHYHQLLNRGVAHVERELFHSSLKMGEQCLQGLGMRAHQARRARIEFERHDEKVTAKIGEHIGGDQPEISTSTQARAEVLELLQADLLERRQHDDHHAWDAIGHE